MAGLCAWLRLSAGLWFSAMGVTWAQGVVEGFEGGAVTLRCETSIQGTLEWRIDGSVILTKPVGGEVLKNDTLWKDVIDLVGNSSNLRISSLSRQRDDGHTFSCAGTVGGKDQTTVSVLTRITGALIESASEGQVTLTEGTLGTLTCTVSGNPKPVPSYNWTVDDVSVSGEGENYTFTANRSMKSVSCTVTNTYSNGSVLSTAKATATLDVLYLDPPRVAIPIAVTENDTVHCRCFAQGNPPPTYAWRLSGSAEVKSASAYYIIQNAQRSDAVSHTCNVTNSVGIGQTVVTLVVQYPSEVTVTYNNSARTLTCTAEGIPNFHIFSLWEHRLGGTLIRKLGTPAGGTWATYSLSDTLTYRDTGNYVCSATNGVKSEQSSQVYVAPPTPAVFQNQSEKFVIGLGRTETISLPFYVRSSSGNVQVRWEKAGENDALQSHREKVGVVSLVVYGQLVNISGTVTVLTLTDVRETDEGNYSVTVTSDINSVTQTSSVSIYVTVMTNSDGTTSNTGAIVGGLIGSLMCVVVIAVVVVVYLKRSRLEGLTVNNAERQWSSIGGPSGDLRTSPREAETSDQPAASQPEHNYESMGHGNRQSPESVDLQYESLAVPTRATAGTSQMDQVTDSDTRTRPRSAEEESYENLSCVLHPAER